jgi:hypothetical protein
MVCTHLGTGAIQCPNPPALADPDRVELKGLYTDRKPPREVLAGPARNPRLGCGHLRAAAKAKEPLTSTDGRDLADVLGVPHAWLRDGWASTDAAGGNI